MSAGNASFSHQRNDSRHQRQPAKLLPMLARLITGGVPEQTDAATGNEYEHVDRRHWSCLCPTCWPLSKFPTKRTVHFLRIEAPFEHEMAPAVVGRAGLELR